MPSPPGWSRVPTGRRCAAGPPTPPGSSTGLLRSGSVPPTPGRAWACRGALRNLAEVRHEARRLAPRRAWRPAQGAELRPREGRRRPPPSLRGAEYGEPGTRGGAVGPGRARGPMWWGGAERPGRKGRAASPKRGGGAVRPGRARGSVRLGEAVRPGRNSRALRPGRASRAARPGHAHEPVWLGGAVRPGRRVRAMRPGRGSGAVKPGRAREPVRLGGAVKPGWNRRAVRPGQEAELLGPAELRALGSGTEKPAVCTAGGEKEQ